MASSSAFEDTTGTGSAASGSCSPAIPQSWLAADVDFTQKFHTADVKKEIVATCADDSSQTLVVPRSSLPEDGTITPMHCDEAPELDEMTPDKVGAIMGKLDKMVSSMTGQVRT